LGKLSLSLDDIQDDFFLRLKKDGLEQIPNPKSEQNNRETPILKQNSMKSPKL